MEIAELYEIYRSYPRIITDSRVPAEGSIFFGLRGEHFNGNLYAPEALRKGALFAVVDDPSVSRNEQCILVDDSLKTLQHLAAFHRKRLSIPLVAITGSNGKTTTKELAAGILSTQYTTHATSGNLNNHIGVPLTLLGISDAVEIGIIEMGANHAGEIARLCSIAMPDYGLITNIGRAHLEGFGSLEGIKRAKKELYDYLGEKGGLVFVNEQDSILRDMLADHAGGVSWYGGSGDSLLRGEVLAADPALRIRLVIRGSEIMDMETGLIGSYNLENILAAACVGLHFGISTPNIKKAIQQYRADNNRSQQLSTDHNVLIMDAYNANPTSMKAAIENFRSMKHPAKAVILGDMLELGEATVAAHKEIIELLGPAGFSEVILVGPVFARIPVPASYQLFQSVSACAVWLQKHPLRDRMVLLKGSRGIGLEKLAAFL